MLRQRILPNNSTPIERFARNIRPGFRNGMRAAPQLFDPFHLEDMSLSVSRSRTAHTAGLRRARNDVRLFRQFARIRPRFLFSKPESTSAFTEAVEEAFTSVLREQEAGRKVSGQLATLLQEYEAELLTSEQALDRLRAARTEVLSGSDDPKQFRSGLRLGLPLPADLDEFEKATRLSLNQHALNELIGHGLSELLDQTTKPLEALHSSYSPDPETDQARAAFLLRPKLLKQFSEELLRLPTC